MTLRLSVPILLVLLILLAAGCTSGNGNVEEAAVTTSPSYSPTPTTPAYSPIPTSPKISPTATVPATIVTPTGTLPTIPPPSPPVDVPVTPVPEKGALYIEPEGCIVLLIPGDEDFYRLIQEGGEAALIPYYHGTSPVFIEGIEPGIYDLVLLCGEGLKKQITILPGSQQNITIMMLFTEFQPLVTPTPTPTPSPTPSPTLNPLFTPSTATPTPTPASPLILPRPTRQLIDDYSY